MIGKNLQVLESETDKNRRGLQHALTSEQRWWHLGLLQESTEVNRLSTNSRGTWHLPTSSSSGR